MAFSMGLGQQGVAMISTAYPHTILALFSDSTDEAAFAPLLEGFSGVINFVNPLEQKQFVSEINALGINPLLVIISSRIYPEARPEMVSALRNIFPLAEILLVTLDSDPIPPLEQLAIDRVRHLLVSPTDEDIEGISALQEAIIKLLLKSPWKLLDCVKPGTRVHEIRLNSSEEKETLILMLEDVIKGDSTELEFLRQRAALLADEMVENALYGAPRDAEGRKLYSKGEFRVINENELIHFCFAFDGETLAMEITDGWGTLVPEMVIDYLARNQDHMAKESDDTGGRGLFIIWKFLDHLHVNIRPGMQTVLGGQIKADFSLDCEAPKGFTISTNYI
jgi:hypothetical protein